MATTNTYAFTVAFTRADEDHAVVHEIGYNVAATTQAQAEKTLRTELRHLTVNHVTLAATLNDDGDVVEPEKTHEGLVRGQLRTFLQSIATTAVVAQETADDPRELEDALESIEGDLAHLRRLNLPSLIAADLEAGE